MPEKIYNLIGECAQVLCPWFVILVEHNAYFKVCKVKVGKFFKKEFKRLKIEYIGYDRNNQSIACIKNIDNDIIIGRCRVDYHIIIISQFMYLSFQPLKIINASKIRKPDISVNKVKIIVDLYDILG